MARGYYRASASGITNAFLSSLFPTRRRKCEENETNFRSCLSLIQVCEAVESGSSIGMLIAQSLRADSEGALEEKFSLLIPCLISVEQSEIVQASCYMRMLTA